MITFRKAIREDVNLIIGLIGPSGGGKTYSAMLLASGIAGDKPFVVIDTEAGRAKHYAEEFNFDHGDLEPPFRPESYTEAILAADKAGYPVIVVDSCSHEWAGTGGVIEWHDEELDGIVERAMKKNQNAQEWKIRESNGMRAWIKPKTAHKRMVQSLLQVRAQLILCFRAEEKTKMVNPWKDAHAKWLTGGPPPHKELSKKTEIVNIGWQPICEKNLPYELIASFLLSPDNPGLPIPLKLEEQHKGIFGPGEFISKEMGSRLHDWATGAPEIQFISKVQSKELWTLAQKAKMSPEGYGAWMKDEYKVNSSAEIKKEDFEEIKDKIMAGIDLESPSLFDSIPDAERSDKPVGNGDRS